MNLISDILFWISNGLLVPVVVLLIILFIRSLLLIGSFFGQYLAIRRTDALLRQQLDTLTIDTLPELEGKLPVKSNSLVIAYIRRVLESKDRPAHVQRLLADFEITADKDLAISKTLTKMGPMLGLMGTLIPMGPALVGLSTGDIASMAYNMQVAFATTVVGLFSSAIGFITQQMSMKMGDLAKRKEPDAPAKNTTPLRQPVRPQGRPTRGKEKIKSRTMSLEDEYFELLEMMKFIPRFEKFTRSDVIRAAIFHLAEKSPQEIEDIVKLNEAITAADVTMRTDEIKRELMKKG